MTKENQFAAPPGLNIRNWAVLGAMVAAYAVYNVGTFIVAAESNHSPGPPILAFALIGGGLAQANMLGLWAALGPGLTRVRLPLTLAAAILSVCAAAAPAFWYAACNPRGGTPPAGGVAGVAGSVGLLVVAASVLVGKLFHRVTRQSFAWTLQQDPTAAAKPFQFSMRYLLGLTTLCALLLTMVAPFLRDIERPSEPAIAIFSRIGIAAGVMFAIGLPTLVIPWAILTLQPREVLVAAGACFWILWTVIIIAVFAAIERQPEVWWLLLSLQVGAAVVAAATSIALYSSGLRLLPNEHPVAAELQPLIVPQSLS